MAKKMRIYNVQRDQFLSARACACAELMSWKGYPICRKLSHAATDIHHKRGRVGKLLLDMTHWLPVCRLAHNWIHDNPAEAKSKGLLESSQAK